MTFPRERPEDVLRQAFEARAERVQVSPDALEMIRTRVSRRRRTFTMSFASLATAATATVTAVVVGLVSCVPPDVPSLPPGAIGSTADSRDVSARLPVYYLGTVPGGPVLYREFHTHVLPEDSLTLRLRAAVADMLTGNPLDPDYSSAWPASATVRDVTLDGEVAVIDLSGAKTNTVSGEYAQMAVQQLVWTVTAVTADRGVQLKGVRLLLDGQPVRELWDLVSTGGDLTRAGALQTLAAVWLISPQEGDTVSGTFDVHVAGAVPGATAQLRVRKLDRTLVEERPVPLVLPPSNTRGEDHVSVTLPAGRYTLEAFYLSSNGGSVRALDNHTITVR